MLSSKNAARFQFENIRGNLGSSKRSKTHERTATAQEKNEKNAIEICVTTYTLHPHLDQNGPKMSEMKDKNARENLYVQTSLRLVRA